MWIKHPNGDVRNLENGHVFTTRAQRDTVGVETWEIVSACPPLPNFVVMTGIPDREIAQENLDSLLTALDITPVELEKVLKTHEDIDSKDEEETE